MFKKYFSFSLLVFIININNIDAMLGCDYKALNRKVDAYLIAVESNQHISKEVFQRDLQFLSNEASNDKLFSEFTNIHKFEELYARKIISPKISKLADLCKDVFMNSSDNLKKAQVFILLNRVVTVLEILQNTGITFVPTVFD